MQSPYEEEIREGLEKGKRWLFIVWDEDYGYAFATDDDKDQIEKYCWIAAHVLEVIDMHLYR